MPQAVDMVPGQKRKAKRQGRTQTFWREETIERSFTRSLNQVRPTSVMQPAMVLGITRRLVVNYKLCVLVLNLLCSGGLLRFHLNVTLSMKWTKQITYKITGALPEHIIRTLTERFDDPARPQ